MKCGRKGDTATLLKVLQVLVEHWALGEPCTAGHIKSKLKKRYTWRPEAYVGQLQAIGVLSKVSHHHQFVEYVLHKPIGE